MQYGQIFSDTFRILWREKKLWVFGLIGLALSSVLGMVGGAAGLNFQRQVIETVNRELSRGRPGGEDEVLAMILGNFAIFGVLIGLVLLGALVSYVINLAMRAGTVREAMRAWNGESVSIRRGSREGASSMLGFFGVDVLWAILPMLVVGGAYALTFVSIFSIAAADAQGGASDTAAVGVIGSILLAICCLAIFALLYAAVYAIFAPMMYQSLAQGRRSFGDALSEAWALGKAHWGTLIVFALMVWGIGLVFSLVVQLITTPFSGLFMGDWMESIVTGMEGANPVMPMPNYGIMIPLLMVTTILSYLTTSFLQSFRFTLYAKVYGELTAPEMPESAAVVEVVE